MKSFVITIEDLPQSVLVAERCISSAEKFNLKTEIFPAVTPKQNPTELFKKLGMSTAHFKSDVGSRPENVLSTFLSHYRLWNLCSQGKETYVIFEHDAVVVNEIPKFSYFQGCMNIGSPSYGKWQTPPQLGINPLTSKQYFPGAHAYMLRPEAAKRLCETAITHAMATDVFLQLSLFPWLEEFYPWPVIAKDSFTTIQNKTGVQAKHNYKKNPTNYEFIKV
jgi:GR25 family glycosyltransferase involved in LPS biosynthesis